MVPVCVCVCLSVCVDMHGIDMVVFVCVCVWVCVFGCVCVGGWGAGRGWGGGVTQQNNNIQERTHSVGGIRGTLWGGRWGWRARYVAMVQ